MGAVSSSSYALNLLQTIEMFCNLVARHLPFIGVVDERASERRHASSLLRHGTIAVDATFCSGRNHPGARRAIGSSGAAGTPPLPDAESRIAVYRCAPHHLALVL